MSTKGKGEILCEFWRKLDVLNFNRKIYVMKGISSNMVLNGTTKTSPKKGMFNKGKRQA